MERIMRSIFEFILEGTIGLGTNRKAPLLLRVLVLFLFLLIYGGLIIFLILLAFQCWKEGNRIGAVLFLGINIVFEVIVIGTLRKKVKEYNEIIV